VVTIRSPATTTFTVASATTASSARRSMNARNDSSWKYPCSQPVARRTSSSKEPSAASKWYPSCSSSLTRSRTVLARSSSISIPSSVALLTIDARPACSDTTIRVRLPTRVGEACS
jgi:hypothetical protein